MRLAVGPLTLLLANICKSIDAPAMNHVSLTESANENIFVLRAQLSPIYYTHAFKPSSFKESTIHVVHDAVVFWFAATSTELAKVFTLISPCCSVLHSF